MEHLDPFVQVLEAVGARVAGMFGTDEPLEMAMRLVLLTKIGLVCGYLWHLWGRQKEH